MADMISPVFVSPGLLTPQTPASTTDLVRTQAKDAAQKFEGQFLSIMLQQMFQGVPTDGPFGGGFGEEMFRSMMTDAMGKEMVKTGGIGLADTVQREILKMQGLN
jgi:Rod binding domain-containing protein